MAAFPINADKARRLLPGNELHPLKVMGRGLLLVTVVDYRVTDIGKYVEYSVAIACTHGPRPAPPLLPLLFPKWFGVGQFVCDLPVSSEISVKGGKGIWGMPKHQASLDFIIGEDWVSSQYDLDGRLVMRVDVRRPRSARFPLSMGAINYCQFRGMLMKSFIHFRGRIGFSLFRKGSAKLVLGDHPRVQPLRELEIGKDPVFSGFFPQTQGTLDDHFEAWFLSYDKPPLQQPEGLESVIALGLGQEWLTPPRRTDDASPAGSPTPESAHARDAARP
jgi:hypothetical protein